MSLFLPASFPLLVLVRDVISTAVGVLLLNSGGSARVERGRVLNTLLPPIRGIRSILGYFASKSMMHD